MVYCDLLFLMVLCTLYGVEPRESQTFQISASILLLLFLQSLQYWSLSRCLKTVFWLTDSLIWRQSGREKIMKNKSGQKKLFYVSDAVHRVLCLISHLTQQPSEGCCNPSFRDEEKENTHEKMSTLPQLTGLGFESLKPDSKVCISPRH